ncbi:MAG TPA: uroporphyrinogen-III C-methyltransferase, partial [Myxococcota bacterium]|nr:uroporphyrinogen-III C-methyltransferase [Myxococcota bacterium]
DTLSRLRAPTPPDMNETSPPPASASTPVPMAARPAQRRGADRLARLLALLALLAGAAAAWLAYDARLDVQSLESTAGARLAELGAESRNAKAALAQAHAAMREAQARVAELEGRVADTQEQRAALEEMYRELSRSADDRLLSEIEQLLVAAGQQLQLAGNVGGALAALQEADQRLARADKLAATPLRRAITQDMERLKAVPRVDTVGLAVKLDGLIAQIDKLPLLVAESPRQPRVVRIRPDDEHVLTRAARDLWEEMKGLVRIRSLDTPEPQLLAPRESYFLRENLKLRLMAARVSLLARDQATFREDLRAAEAWIARHFDAKAQPTTAALETLRQVAATPLDIAVPDINASLAAARAARAARESR